MIRIPRVFADEQGETHFGVMELPRRDAALGPPPHPVGRVTDPIPVSSLLTFATPAGTGVSLHPAPQPYLIIVLSGEGEVEVSDGDTRRLSPGDMCWFDDLSGKGHIARAITDLHIAFINRAVA